MNQPVDDYPQRVSKASAEMKNTQAKPNSGSSSKRVWRQSIRPSTALSMVLLLVMSACSSSPDDPVTPDTSTQALELVETSKPPKVLPPIVKETVDSLTTEQKVGQLLMPVFYGSRARDITAAQKESNLTEHGYETPAELVDAYQLGGVIYLESNIESAAQISELSADLQEVAKRDAGLGLLVAVDQEGGRVSRISDRVSAVPSAAEYQNDVIRAENDSYAKGQQVAQQGINVVLAPVADVVSVGASSIGDRSFGSDPTVVADLTKASVRGLQLSGVAAACETLAGHGATSIDSHDSLPTVNVDEASWRSSDRVPFEAAIEEEVAVVLVGHLALPGLDPTSRPATVSPVLVNDLLRDDLGFEGVVMSDALNMGAVGNIDPGELVVQAVLAGIDILLVPESLTIAYAALIAAVAEGRISVEQLDDSVTRILKLKHDLGLFPEVNLASPEN